jgi:hypothetical protein
MEIPDGWDDYTEEDDKLWYDGPIFPDEHDIDGPRA